MTETRTRKGTVLLLGATGFIGGRLLDALQTAGYEVICGVRRPEAFEKCTSIQIDFTRDRSQAVWRARLEGVDIVINAVGILRESRRASFEALHVAGPAALFAACAQAQVTKVIQISALGADTGAVSGYHRSKKRGDDALAATRVPWTIVHPSLVFGVGGASAALFTRLAALPAIPVPGDGSQQVQPIHIDDLVAAILQLLETHAYDGQRLAAVGPRPVTLRDFLGALRQGMDLGKPCFLHIPLALVHAAAAAGDRFKRMLLDRDSLGMLLRGNVGSAANITALLGRAPRPVESFIEPAWARAIANEARLAWLLPLLRITVALLWIATGIVSLGIYPISESYALLARVGLTGVPATLALYSAAALDLALGVAILIARRRRWLWKAQMALILGYTVIITIFLPEFWLHPYGPVLKNVPLLAAILLLHEFEKPDA